MNTIFSTQQLELKRILSSSPVGQVLPAISQLNLPDWWLAGGAVRNTVWKAIFGNECQLIIKDFDIAFFDINGNRDQELAAKENLINQFPNHDFDVKNQASFARWRSGFQTYTSTEDGIRNWLHTATTVGVRINQQGEWQFFAPYGFDDLFNGTICPTPENIDNPDAINKAASFIEKCPCLKMKNQFII